MEPVVRERTVPGFTLQSSNFQVKFVTALQLGYVSNVLEYETDWMGVMYLVLDTLEMFPEDVDKIEEVLAKSYEDRIVTQAGPRHLNIQIATKLGEEVYFTPPLGSKKSLRISFTDLYSTVVIFHIKKRSTMKSLKELSSAAVAQHLRRKEDLLHLELPITLYKPVALDLQDGWTPRRYWENIDCCHQHKNSHKLLQAGFNQFYRV